MARIPRPCLDCGTLTRNQSRCYRCQAKHMPPDWAERSRAQRRAFPFCRVCGATTDLTADHVTPGNPNVLQTLCRSCNSKRGSPHFA